MRLSSSLYTRRVSLFLDLFDAYDVPMRTRLETLDWEAWYKDGKGYSDLLLAHSRRYGLGGIKIPIIDGGDDSNEEMARLHEKGKTIQDHLRVLSTIPFVCFRHSALGESETLT